MPQFTVLFYKNNVITKALILTKKFANKLRTKTQLLSHITQEQNASLSNP